MHSTCTYNTTFPTYAGMAYAQKLIHNGRNPIIFSQNKKKQFLMVICPGEVNDSRLHIKKDLYDYWEFEPDKKYFILETNKRYANRTI